MGYASRRGLLSWGDVEHLVLRGHSEGPVRAHPDPCLGDSSRGSWSPRPLAQAQAMRQHHSDALPGLTPNLPGDSHRKISPHLSFSMHVGHWEMRGTALTLTEPHAGSSSQTTLLQGKLKQELLL